MAIIKKLTMEELEKVSGGVKLTSDEVNLFRVSGYMVWECGNFNYRVFDRHGSELVDIYEVRRHFSEIKRDIMGASGFSGKQLGEWKERRKSK